MSVASRTKNPIPAEHRLGLMTLLVVALGAAWAPNAAKMPLWFGPGLAALAALRLFMAHRGMEIKNRKFLLPPTLLAAWWTVTTFRPFFGGNGALALLAVMVTLKLFESYKVRDFLLLSLVGYVLAATRILSAQTPASALWMLGLCVVFTYLIVAYGDRTGKRTVKTNIAIVARLMVLALPVMMLLYLIFPRTGAPLWLLRGGGKTVTGMTDTIRLGSLAEVAQSDEVVFIATFDGPPPKPEELYWRGLVLDRFDGQVWSVSYKAPSRAPLVVEGNAPEGYRRQRISLFPHSGRWLYALDRPVSSVPGRAALHLDNTLLTDRKVTDQLNYRVASMTMPLDDVTPPALDPLERAKALALPEDYSPRIRALSAKLAEGAVDEEELTLRVLSHFIDEGFTYTLKPTPYGREALEGFLFESRKGFCAHFATSFAALMRSAGVPTRVVLGYLGADTSPWFNQLMVQQLHAHAWNEVWVDGRGWVRVDPTTAASPGRLTSSIDTDASLDGGAIQFEFGDSFLGNLRELFGYSYLSFYSWWSEWVVGYDRQKQLELLRGVSSILAGKSILYALSAIVLIGWLAALTAAALGQQARGADPFERAWRRWLTKLRRAGLTPSQKEGPLDFGKRIAKERPELSGEALRISAFYSRCRYGKPLGREQRERLRVFKGMVAASRAAGSRKTANRQSYTGKTG